MRRKRYFKHMLLVSLIFIFSGCNSQKQEIEFGTEIINENVVLPEIAYKEDVLACYDAEGKIVYTLGTRHQKHFYPQCEYSLQDIQSVIENVNPDYVFIECREEIFDTYQALDGPQEFQFIYAYCIDHNISVELIDWYLTDNETITKTNSTSDERDNKIFYNIYDKMHQVKDGETVLICYGDMHFYYQQPRMERAGWEKIELEDTKQFFVSKQEGFLYPESMLQIVQNCIDYYGDEFMEEVCKNVTDPDALLLYEQTAIRGEQVYERYKKMVQEQKIYY